MNQKKKVTKDTAVSKENVEDVKKEEEIIDPWELLLFGRRRTVPSPEKQADESQQMNVEGSKDNENNDKEKKGFSWI